MRSRPTPYRTLAALALLLCSIASGSAQSSFDEWKQQQDRAFQEFLDEEDAAFRAFLEKEWIAFQAFVSRGYYEEPKLRDPPRVEDPVKRRPDPAPAPRPAPDPAPPARPEGGRSSTRPADEPPPARTRTERLSFHGTVLELDVPEAVFALGLASVSPEGFADYWTAAAAAGTDALVEQLRAVAARHRLNDFTYFQLVVDLATALFDSRNDSAAAAWHLMVASGYDLRIAYSDSALAFLLPSSQTLYGYSFFPAPDRRYYLFDADGSALRTPGRWRTYEGNHAEATRLVGLGFGGGIDLPERLRNEELSFSYEREEFTITLPVNEHLVGLLREYPFTDWYVHFAPSVSRSARSELAEQLRRIVRGRSAPEAANLLLRFVQTAFPYQTDQEHFGFEKWQSPEEILYYRYSDCDDRSVLYAYLLENVLGWDDAAVLNYPGHLAVAVPQSRLPGVSGDTVTQNGVRYLVTDPTYIGADIGMAMPQFRNVQPTVHSLRDRP
ncbi:MAG: hypothetical protein ACOC1U_02530 [Spirochaetota bacterium]